MKQRLRALLCLAAFLAYFLLPLAHEWHLSSHAPSSPCHCGTASQSGGTFISPKLSQVPQESGRHHHDPSTCPLCQAALGPGKLAFTLFLAGLVAVEAGQRFCFPEPATSLSPFSYFLFESRAPPQLPLM